MIVKVYFLLIVAVVIAGVSAGGPSKCGSLPEKFRVIYELVIERSRSDFGAVRSRLDRLKYLCNSSLSSAESYDTYYTDFVYKSVRNLTSIDDRIIKAIVENNVDPPEPLDCIIGELSDLISKIKADFEELKKYIAENCVPTTLGPNTSCPEVLSYVSDLQSMSESEGISRSPKIFEFYTKANALGLGSIALEVLRVRTSQVPMQFTMAVGEIGNVDPSAVLDFIEGRSENLPAPLDCATHAIAEMYSGIQQLLEAVYNQITAPQ